MICCPDQKLEVRIFGKQSSSSPIPPLCKNINDSLAISEYEKATATPTFVKSQILTPDNGVPFFENRTNTSVSGVVVSQSEVVDILSTLKINKVTGPDGISHRMLKQT